MTLPVLITRDTKAYAQARRGRTTARYAAIASGVRLQGCKPFKCAGLIIACAGACASGIGTVACIGCLGGAYDECKDCF